MSIDLPDSASPVPPPSRLAWGIRPFAIVLLAVAGVGLLAFNALRRNGQEIPPLTPAAVADEPHPSWREAWPG
jgi:hypothetical protein